MDWAGLEFPCPCPSSACFVWNYSKIICSKYLETALFYHSCCGERGSILGHRVAALPAAAPNIWVKENGGGDECRRPVCGKQAGWRECLRGVLVPKER